MLDKVDPGPSRFKGYELFRLHLALVAKYQRGGGQDEEKKAEEVVPEAQEVLVEAHWLLSDDLTLPREVESAYTRCRQELGEEVVENLRRKVEQKYGDCSQYIC